MLHPAVTKNKNKNHFPSVNDTIYIARPTWCVKDEGCRLVTEK